MEGKASEVLAFPVFGHTHKDTTTMSTRTNTEPVPERTLPRDAFSSALRELEHHPGAVKASSRVDITNLYGDRTTWTIDTYRVDGQQTSFLQVLSATESHRLVLPPKVMQALTRQQDGLTAQNRRRGAQQAVATRIARGDVLGNPEALRLARRAPRRSKRKGGAK